VLSGGGRHRRSQSEWTGWRQGRPAACGGGGSAARPLAGIGGGSVAGNMHAGSRRRRSAEQHGVGQRELTPTLSPTVSAL
jgi:hypothetical protein